MSIFNSYGAGIEELKKDPKMQRGEDFEYFNEPGEYIAELTAIKEGFSKNPRNQGDPYVIFQVRILETLSEGGKEPGSNCSLYFALPSHDNPERWKLREKYSLRDALHTAAAFLKLDPEYVGAAHMADLASDEGARVKGLRAGISVKASNGKDGKTYYNPRAYPVDNLGHRLEKGFTPEERKAYVAANPPPASPSIVTPPTTPAPVDPKIKSLLEKGLDPREFGFPDYQPSFSADDIPF